MPLFTLGGPALALAGYLSDFQILFWLGVIIASLNLGLNVASGVMPLPVLPAALIFAGAAILSPWHFGASVGLLVWTTLEGAGELIPRRRVK